MYASCEKCCYDSEDTEDYETLMDKVKSDGGNLKEFKCPNGHEALNID